MRPKFIGAPPTRQPFEDLRRPSAGCLRTAPVYLTSSAGRIRGSGRAPRLGLPLAAAPLAAACAAGDNVDAGVDARLRPNIVFLLSDDQSYGTMGHQGKSWLRTPGMDRLAAEGARFTRAFVTTSLCSPSRASFLSGRWARSHGVLDNQTCHRQKACAWTYTAAPAITSPRELMAWRYMSTTTGRTSSPRL